MEEKDQLSLYNCPLFVCAPGNKRSEEGGTNKNKYFGLVHTFLAHYVQIVFLREYYCGCDLRSPGLAFEIIELEGVINKQAKKASKQQAWMDCAKWFLNKCALLIKQYSSANKVLNSEIMFGQA